MSNEQLLVFLAGLLGIGLTISVCWMVYLHLL